SRILQRQISGDGDRAGFGIDLDFGDMTGTGIGKGVRAPINIGFEAGIELWRKAIARGSLEDARELAEFYRELRSADHANLSVRNFEIVLGCFKHVARQLFRFLRYRTRGEQHG